MSEQLAIDILKIVLPVVAAIIAWQQKQIQDNRKYIEKLLDRCFEDDKTETNKKPWE